MILEKIATLIGVLIRHSVGWRWLAYLRRRALRFDLTVHGEEHLDALRGKPFIIVSNHVHIRKSELWPLGYIRPLSCFHHSPDSFVYFRIVRRRLDQSLHTVVRTGTIYLSKMRWLLWLQIHFFTPLLRSSFRKIPGLVGVALGPGTSLRDFLHEVAEPLKRGEPLVFFPQPLDWLECQPLADVNTGPVHLARRHNLILLTACIVGTETWRRGAPVTVAFSEPILPGWTDKEQINREIVARIEALLDIHSPARNGGKFRQPGK